MANKFALLIGINYINTQYQLEGCINDIIMMRKYLIEKKGYIADNICVMRDDIATYDRPTRENIINKLVDLINKANVNKSPEIFFHYSGHGTNTIDRNKDEADGTDEMICPVDFNFILDDELRAILTNLNNNTVLNCIIDSCYSATSLDLPYLYNRTNNNLVLLQDNSKLYKSLLTKNIFCISGCKDNQTSADAYNIYQPYNSGNSDFSITTNKSGGALTAYLLKLFNTKYNFTNCIPLLQQTLKSSGYNQIPLLATSKLIILKNKKVDHKVTLKNKICIKKLIKNNKKINKKVIINQVKINKIIMNKIIMNKDKINKDKIKLLY